MNRSFLILDLDKIEEDDYTKNLEISATTSNEQQISALKSNDPLIFSSTSKESCPVTSNTEQTDFILTISSPKLDRNVKRFGAVNKQSHQEDANTSNRKPEVIYLDTPQIQSTETTIKLKTPGTQDDTDQGRNIQTDSPVQPKHTEKTNNSNAHIQNNIITPHQPNEQIQAQIEATIEKTQDSTSNQTSPIHTRISSIVAV